MRSRIVKRAPSGRVIRPVGKKDFRSGIKPKNGTPFKISTSIAYRDTDKFVSENIKNLISDNSGKTYKSLRNITVGTTLMTVTDKKIKVTSRTKDRLVGLKLN